MKYILTALTSVAVLTGCSQQSGGEYLGYTSGSGKILTSYTAELSYKDHFGANGQRLQSVGAIIRRDRENFSNYGEPTGHRSDFTHNQAKNQDRLDTWGRYTTSRRDQEALERLVNDGYVSPRDRDIILNDYPLVRVTIYNGNSGGDRVRVQIIDDNARSSSVENNSGYYNSKSNCRQSSNCR